MSSIEQAKSLLKKAIEIGDNELIELANSILQTYNVDAKQRRESTGTKAQSNDFIFSMPKQQEDKTLKSGVPVNQIQNRTNTFYDDGTEFKDVITPSIKPAERKRPAFKMIEQTCQKCGKTKTTHPAHKREYYICDKCIAK
jgi:hypothetical protein